MTYYVKGYFLPHKLYIKSVKFIKKVLKFLSDVAQDERVPSRDKKILLALIALIVSPLDLIPDWIPFFGLLDDLVMVALVLDYYFEYLEPEILLSHYPWGMKSFASLRRLSRMITWLTPGFIRDRVWQYRPSPYRR